MRAAMFTLVAVLSAAAVVLAPTALLLYVALQHG